MPKPTQHSLIPFLLLWIAILSIVQVVSIVLFFTAGHQCPPQNPERPMQFQANNTPSSPSAHGLLLNKGKMLTYRATQVNGKIKWSAKDPDEGLISGGGKVLKIKKDGHFFLNLQVTLSSCATLGLQHTVSMRKNNKTILHGWINPNTCSTGLLGKVEDMFADCTLEVNLPTTDEPINENLTHLDIIYMPKMKL
ncbi:hypothetical protein VZT92_007613 [Zoarces viviparus]|uniref:Uncharacterized protein n=1 Tax=Zoarces viviparus TaxID=48416 RepID=A0AAW1FLX5_ZOAVI